MLGALGEGRRILAFLFRQGNRRSRHPHGADDHPNRTTLGEELVLPGTVQAYVEAPIYARNSGYRKEWRTDIGAQVVSAVAGLNRRA